MKKIALLLMTSIVLSACQAEEDHSVQYIEGAETEETTQAPEESSAEEVEGQAVENRTIEQVNAEEGISAEQIVVKITADGYVTTHGDHFHAYSGPVPENALIGESLFTEEAGEIVSDHLAGEVVLVGGEYLFRVTEPDSPLLRSEEEVASQASGNDPGQTWPGAEFRNEAGQLTTDDGYVFNPEDVTEKTDLGYIVPQGDVEYIFPEERLTNFEIKLVEDHLNSIN